MSTLTQASYQLLAQPWGKLCARMLLVATWPLHTLKAIGQLRELLRRIASGQLHWIGSRNARPSGLISSYRLHKRMAMALDDEAEWDLHDRRSRGWQFDVALLIRYGWSLILGKKESQTEDRWPLLGLWIDNIRHAQIVEQLQLWRSQPFMRRIAFVNPHCANVASKDPLYRGVLNSADLLLPDGSGVLLASRVLKTPLQENTNGTDLFPILCRQWQADGARLFLLGGRDGVAQAVAAHLLQKYPGLHIAGTHHGYSSEEYTPHLLAQIRHSHADVLVVAMGVPLQDTWIARHQEATGVKLAIGVGGLFDFLSGRIARAPVWLRELGLEWCWRLLQEPKRMWQRYLVGNFTFLARVMRQKFSPRPLAAPQPRQEITASSPSEQALLLVDYALWQGDDAVGMLLTPLLGHSQLELTMIRLVEQGVKLVHLFTDEGYSNIQRQLGFGDRWGIEIRYYLSGQQLQTRRRLAALNLPESVWLVAPGCLPHSPLHSKGQCQWEIAPGIWSGWAYLKSKRLKLALNRPGLPLPQIREPFAGISLCNPQQLNEALPQLLRDAPPYMPDYQEVKHQVWLARGALCEKGVTLVGPAVVGSNCLIRRGSHIGPNVVLGEGCVIDREVDIHDTLVKPNSYIAAQMSIAHGLVGNRQLHLVQDDTILRFKIEECLIDDLRQPHSRPSYLERMQAMGAVMWLSWQHKRLDQARWQNLTNRLRQVIRGQCHLIGLPSLSQHASQSLEQKNLRLGAIRLSELQPATLPAQGVNQAEQDYLTDLYGAATTQYLSWQQLQHLVRSLHKSRAHFAIKT